MHARKYRTLVSVVAALAAKPGMAVRAADSDLKSAYERCQALPDGPMRLDCYESAAKGELDMQGARSIGSWRMVRTPHPQGGKAAISIMRPANLVGSDPDFAGLMIRCGQPDLEVLPVIIHPLPLHAKATVTIGVPPDRVRMDAVVAPPGSAVLLPEAATRLAKGAWQRHASLTIEIASEAGIVRGSVSLDGLESALAALSGACSER